MAYKDRERQKQANREASRRRRLRQQGMTQRGNKVIPVIPKEAASVIPNYGQSDCECRHCRNNRAKGNRHIINHGAYKPAHLLADNELNRVSLPGDADYDGVCNDAKYDGKRIPQAVQVGHK